MSCCGGTCGCSSDDSNKTTQGCCSDATATANNHQGGCCGGHDHAVELSAEQIAILNRLIEDNSDEELTPEEIEQIRTILFAQG